jgi:GT2 family glycosyltransferase
MDIQISVIIVNYNSFNLLEDCLSSLYKYNLCDIFEVIVVDNNSTGNNVNEVIKNYKGIKLIKTEKNIGFAAANNRGFELAEGKYVLFLNNDTIFTENSLEKILNFVKKNDNEIAIGCKLLNPDGTHQESINNFFSIWNLFTENFFFYKFFPKSRIFNKYYQNYLDIKETQEVDVVKGAFLFCSSEAFKKLNGFDERFYFYAEETDFCFRFKKQIGKVFYFPHTSIIHIGGATTDSNLWFKFKNQCTSRIQIYQKHFKGYRFLLVLFIHYLGLLMRVPLYFCGGIATLKKSLILKSFYYLKQIFIYPQNLF